MFKTALRALFSTLFGVIGLGIGIVVIVWFIAWMSANDPRAHILERYDYEIVANPAGQRIQLDSDSSVILQLPIHGVIGVDVRSCQIEEILLQSREGEFEKNRVKAILLTINSPGGTVFDTDTIYRAILEYKKQYNTPVYAYVDGLCASGGMYIASAADKIYATDVSIIGSVGVIANYFNVHQLFEKLGVDSLTLTAGKDKDTLNPFRQWKPDEDAHMKEIFGQMYDRFLHIVSSARPKLTETLLRDTYGARIYSAEQAKEYGYIDALTANKSSVITELAREARIPVNHPYQIVQFKKSSFLSNFNECQEAIFKGKVIHTVELPGQFHMELLNKPLYLYTN